MRNARNRRNISLMVALACAGVVALTIAIGKGSPAIPGNWFGLVIAGIFGTIFSIVGFLVFHFHHFQRARLERGDRRLAQWTVTAAEWKQFETDEKVRKDAERRNDIKVRPHMLANGAPIIIAENAVLVDDDFYHLGSMRGLQWLPDKLPCLEYNMVTSGKSGSVKWNIRFPVTAGAEAEARKVWDYVFRPAPPGAYERRLRRLRVARTVGVILLVTFAPVLWYGTKAFGAAPIQTDAVKLSLMAGMLIVPFGAFLALLAQVLLKKEGPR